MGRLTPQARFPHPQKPARHSPQSPFPPTRSLRRLRGTDLAYEWGTITCSRINDPHQRCRRLSAARRPGLGRRPNDLRLTYQPRTDRLDGTATLLATATQDLSRFNLDFLLDADEVLVNGKKAAFARSGVHELEVTPAKALERGSPLTVVVRYGGTPSEKKVDGRAAWHRTPDGAVVVDEPTSAPWWYPGNDHPADKATYDISVAVPDGLQAISNGVLASKTSKLGWTRYNWRSARPQASYLSTLAVGRFDITEGTSRAGRGCTAEVLEEDRSGGAALRDDHALISTLRKDHLLIAPARNGPAPVAAGLSPPPCAVR